MVTNGSQTRTTLTNKVVPDKFGNHLIIVGSTGTVKLKLADGHPTRTIGIINPVAKVFHIIRNKQKHLHRKSDSYGFNHYLLDHAQKFDTVILEEQDGKNVNWHKIPKDDIIRYGHFLHFKQDGFELQIFLKLTFLQQYKQTEKLCF